MLFRSADMLLEFEVLGRRMAGEVFEVVYELALVVIATSLDDVEPVYFGVGVL